MNTALIITAEELEGTEATVSQWLVKIGDFVEDGKPIIELETDKVSMEVCAHHSGIVTDLAVSVGDKVVPDMVLAHIDSEKTTADEPSEPVPEPVEEVVVTKEPTTDKATDRLSPAVRRLITENNLDVKDITGSGRHGRITRDDVKQHLANVAEKLLAPASKPDIPAPAPVANMTSRKVPHTRMRKKIADHMVSSLLHTSPHVTSVFEMDLSNIMEHRKWHKNACERQGFSLTFTAYFAYAAALAVKEVPEVNARFHEDHMEYFDHVNFGVGTALGEEGLVVPVIKHIDTMELYDLAKALTEQTDKARNGKLTQEDLRGSTLTISNHGVSGSLFATPIIINQPEVAIIGIGKLEKRPVVRTIDGKDEICIKPMCYVSLTIDHRALDAYQTNRFLTRFVEIIETWQG